MQKTNPGSWEAKRLGCTCPAIDNAFGKGAVVNGQTDPLNFFIDPDCPIHQDMRGLNAGTSGPGTGRTPDSGIVEGSGDSDHSDDTQGIASEQGTAGLPDGDGSGDEKAGGSPT